MSPSTPEDTPLRQALHNLRQTIGKYLDSKSTDVQHKDVIKELYSRTDMTGSYVASLIFANLIALLGLLSNSVAVVIGAMLISPLMGPIFSLGMAFATGNLVLARKAARIIVLSVVITVFAAAFFTLLSPLKEVTNEIIARTRPNLYDLLIAIFAGSIGAIALCTRKNYLFTTTGIAIATAVIPPLSVVGYGIGTLQISMALGGFLLFFTNLVAIVISSDIVFMLLRFRSSMVEEAIYPLKLRLRLLGITLAIISVPLVTTLATDISSLKRSKKIEQTLKYHLNVEKHSRMTSFSLENNEKTIKVLASVNTVNGIDSNMEKKLAKDLNNVIKKPIILELEQVIVNAGSIKNAEDKASLKISPAMQTISPPKDTLETLNSKTVGIIKEACNEAGMFMDPWPIRDCSITFSENNTPPLLNITLGRDFAITNQEQRWLSKAIEKKLTEPVTLHIEVRPLFSEIFIGNENLPEEKNKQELTILKKIVNNAKDFHIIIYYPQSNRKQNPEKIKVAVSLKQYLNKEFSIPSKSITIKASGSSYRLLVTSPNGNQ